MTRTLSRAAVAAAAILLVLVAPAWADSVVPDDQIVQGSLCTGFDCVSGESFGFDTLKLKENNTRLKFEDTSTTAGTATNDWELQANEDGTGGRNLFSLNDLTAA